jgi:hypothetical protein
MEGRLDNWIGQPLCKLFPNLYRKMQRNESMMIEVYEEGE